MDKMERRAYSQSLQATDDEKQVIEGYAVVFNEPSELLSDEGNKRFIEEIASNAFQGVSTERVYALYNHDYDKVLARTDAGNLSIKIDEKGLYFRCVLPNTTLARDVYENVKVGNIRACSFGFIVEEDDWKAPQDKTGVYRRVIRKIKQLVEITLTPYPAYQATTAIATRHIQLLEEKKDDLIKELKKEKILSHLEADRASIFYVQKEE